jgi:hypothetical protein
VFAGSSLIAFAAGLAITASLTGAPSPGPASVSLARASETYYLGSCYRDSWCSWYYSHEYNRNQACAAPHYVGSVVGAKFIRISDGHDLYRVLNRTCADTGYVDWGTCRYALAANGGTYDWIDLNGEGWYPTDC